LAPPATLASHAESSRSTTAGSPLWCHPAIVDAFMMNAPDFQSCHAVESQAQRSRSAGVSFGRFTERCRTPVWCRNTRISNWSAARLRKEADSEAIRAVNMCPKGNRTMSENSQSVSAIGVYENHSHRSWLQGRHRFSSQTVRQVLDGARCQCHHRLALLPPQ
jgi:hypothetical protein